MTDERISRDVRMQVLRDLISDAASETPRTIEDGVEQRGAIRFLQRKLNETGDEVITGD